MKVSDCDFSFGPIFASRSLFRATISLQNGSRYSENKNKVCGTIIQNKEVNSNDTHSKSFGQAKQRKRSPFQRFLGRSQKPLTKIDERSSKNSLAADSNATKRQKLESGYLRKLAHLNHQSLFSHKLPKVRQVDASTMNTRLKVTVPREPALETAHRAQRHRFRNNSESGEHEKSKAPPFKHDH